MQGCQHVIIDEQAGEVLQPRWESDARSIQHTGRYEDLMLLHGCFLGCTLVCIPPHSWDTSRHVEDVRTAPRA